MNLEESIVHLRIEEDNKKIERSSIVQLGVNFVEIDSKVVNKTRKIFSDAPKTYNSKKAKKFKGNYYNFGKVEHRSSKC